MPGCQSLYVVLGAIGAVNHGCIGEFGGEGEFGDGVSGCGRCVCVWVWVRAGAFEAIGITFLTKKNDDVVGDASRKGLELTQLNSTQPTTRIDQHA